MKIVQEKFQSLFRSLLGIPKAPDEMGEQVIGVFNVAPNIGWNPERLRYEPVIVENTLLRVITLGSPAHITTNTTTVLSAALTNRAVVYAVIINAANASAILTFRDSSANTIMVIPAAVIGIQNIINGVGAIHDVVSSGGAAIDATVVYSDYGGDYANLTGLLKGS